MLEENGCADSGGRFCGGAMGSRFLQQVFEAEVNNNDRLGPAPGKTEQDAGGSRRMQGGEFYGEG